MKWRLSAGLALIAVNGALADEFNFDPSEFEKKVFEFSGYAEIKQEAFSLRDDSAGYKLSYLGEDLDWLARSTGTLDVNGVINGDTVVTSAHLQSSYAYDRVDETGDTRIMDGGFRVSPSSSFTIDIGKRVQRWGKGYAWNPVGFIERTKDANDPQSSREGYVMASVDWVKRFDSSFSTLGITAAVVPVTDQLNDDFGSTRHANPALKVYVLVDDTDIDLMWRAEGSRAQAVGADFSRNLLENLEVHGEWARSFDVTQKYIDSSGSSRSEYGNSDSYLLGTRYLTANDITWTAEYYHNGKGYSADELEAYYQYLDNTLTDEATATQIAKATAIASSGYGKSSPGLDYAYFRAAKSEPFEWLYTSVAVTTMVNLNDGSYQVTPELTYSGIKNLEIRSRISITDGGNDTDYGEKKSAQKYEVYARYYF